MMVYLNTRQFFLGGWKFRVRSLEVEENALCQSDYWEKHKHLGTLLRFKNVKELNLLIRAEKYITSPTSARGSLYFYAF